MALLFKVKKFEELTQFDVEGLQASIVERVKRQSVEVTEEHS